MRLCCSLNPWSKARNQNRIVMDTSQFLAEPLRKLHLISCKCKRPASGGESGGGGGRGVEQRLFRRRRRGRTWALGHHPGVGTCGTWLTKAESRGRPSPRGQTPPTWAPSCASSPRLSFPVPGAQQWGGVSSLSPLPPQTHCIELFQVLLFKFVSSLVSLTGI